MRRRPAAAASRADHAPAVSPERGRNREPPRHQSDALRSGGEAANRPGIGRTLLGASFRADHAPVFAPERGEPRTAPASVGRAPERGWTLKTFQNPCRLRSSVNPAMARS